MMTRKVHDPRDELVRRLLEYQRFKEAASELEQRDALDARCVRARRLLWKPRSRRASASCRCSSCLTALRRVLDRLPKDEFHEVTLEKITVREKMTLLLDRLHAHGRVLFRVAV